MAGLRRRGRVAFLGDFGTTRCCHKTQPTSLHRHIESIPDRYQSDLADDEVHDGVPGCTLHTHAQQQDMHQCQVRHSNENKWEMSRSKLWLDCAGVGGSLF